MDPTEFAIGDRVRPLAGGPVMTVDEVYPPVFEARYRCVRDDAAGHPRHELFRGRDLCRARAGE